MTATPRRRLSRLVTPLSALLLAGCQTAAYYGQAVQGQASLMLRRQPIDRLLVGDALAPELRSRLEAVQRIRAFADRELGLPARRQYASYVELGRPYPVWSVTAAPALSLTPKTWCYWFVGCLSYRGYFREAAARRYAAELVRQGYEVQVSGINAYSTLGWFRDPVLSSFLRLPEADLAELIFHELTHQVLYVPGDTVFNESLAVTVAEAGLRRYAAEQGLDLGPLEQARARQQEFVALVLAYRNRLAALFARPLSDADKRAGKATLYAELRGAYAELKQRWGGYGGYDAWFADLNNARLNTVATYYQLVPALRALLHQKQGDVPEFLAACRALARLDLATRHRQLSQLLVATTP